MVVNQAHLCCKLYSKCAKEMQIYPCIIQFKPSLGYLVIPVPVLHECLVNCNPESDVQVTLFIV